MQTCLFCGGDGSDPDHIWRCDGRQGRRDAAADVEDEPIMRARAGDPETSHAAMAAFDREQLRSAVGVIVDLHRRLGPLADFQQGPAFLQAWQRKCCDHLYRQARSVARDAGLLRDSGERLVNPTTNRRQVVWVAVEGDAIDVPRCPTCGAVRRRREVA